jgi:hypothetical protein
MAEKPKVKTFSAGCPAREETANLVRSLSLSVLRRGVLGMNDPNVASRARSLDVRSVPAVVMLCGPWAE